MFVLQLAQHRLEVVEVLADGVSITGSHQLAQSTEGRGRMGARHACLPLPHGAPLTFVVDVATQRNATQQRIEPVGPIVGIPRVTGPRDHLAQALPSRWIVHFAA
jgi:hypothetical protein